MATYNEDKDVVEQYRDFIRRSIKQHGNEVKLQARLLEASAPGNWWKCFIKGDTNNNVIKRAKRLNLDCNSDIHTYADLIASPLSSSPWRIKLDEPNPELDNTISKFESYLYTKETEIMAFTRGVLVGKGWLNLRLEDGNPRLEFIQNQTSVYQDPDSKLPDNSDARECAVINYVPASKYPGMRRLQIDNTDDWSAPGNEGGGSITDAYYYRLEDDGNVYCHHIIGMEPQESTLLPFKRIPILCFSGYNDYSCNKGGIYSGIMQKTWDIQLLRNLCMSQMADRQNRSVKSKVIYSDKAIKDLQGAVTKAMNDETPVLMYREGASAPSMLNETQNYTDLEQINTYCQTKMDAICGVTLASQLPIEKTATEVLLREDKRETSVNTLYSHANMCMHSIAKCIMEAILGEVLPYSLINGPEAVSKNYKLRKDISALATFYEGDETMKAFLGYQVAMTTGDQALIEGLRANLNPNVKLPDSNILDSLREATEANQVAQELSERNAEMEGQLQEATANVQSLQAMLDNNKQQFQLQVAQMKLDEQKRQMDYEVKIAELNAKIAKMEAETNKINAEAQAQTIENVKETQPEEVVVVGGI